MNDRPYISPAGSHGAVCHDSGAMTVSDLRKPVD